MISYYTKCSESVFWQYVVWLLISIVRYTYKQTNHSNLYIQSESDLIAATWGVRCTCAGLISIQTGSLLNILVCLSSLGNKYDVRITAKLGLGWLIVVLLREEFSGAALYLFDILFKLFIYLLAEYINIFFQFHLDLTASLNSSP